VEQLKGIVEWRKIEGGQMSMSVSDFVVYALKFAGHAWL